MINGIVHSFSQKSTRSRTHDTNSPLNDLEPSSENKVFFRQNRELEIIDEVEHR